MTKLLHGNEKNRLTGGREPLFSQKELLVLAIPLLVEQLLEVTVGMADTMMVSRCGEAAISGVSLVDMINNLIIVLFAALATGGAVVVSQYLGAKDRPDADKSAGQLLLLSGLSGAVIGAVCFVLARPMIRLFYGSIDTDVLDAGVKYLQIIALSYPFLALYNGGAALFRSIGNGTSWRFCHADRRQAVTLRRSTSPPADPADASWAAGSQTPPGLYPSWT